MRTPDEFNRSISAHQPVRRWFVQAVLIAGSAVCYGSISVLGSDVRTTATIVVGAMLLVVTIAYWSHIRGAALVAVVVALAISSVYYHAYDTPSIHLGWIDLFPLVMWTGGLLIVYEIYRRLTLSYRLVIGSLIYLAALFALEYLGYYWLGIRETPPHPSLLGLGIIHGPPIIHVFYIAAGPFYLAVMTLVQARLDDAAG
jgi:hypothetical protein